MIFLRVASLTLLLLGVVHAMDLEMIHEMVQGHPDSPIPTGIYPEFRNDSDRQ